MKNVLVLGLGQFGISVVKKLSELDAEVMAVDTDAERVKEALPYVVSAQIGDSTNLEYIESLGVRDFDLVYVCIGDFKGSLETVSLVKESGASQIIAVASSTVHEKFLKKIGADHTIFPEKIIGEWGAIRYGLNDIVDFIQVDEKTGIYELNVPESWLGKTVIDLDIRKKYNLNIIGYKKNSNILQSLSPATVFEKEMIIMVIGEMDNIQKCFKL